MHHARSDDDDDDVESAEEDNEEELLIADPRAYPNHKPWGKREALIVAALLLGWYSVSTSALITNKLILKMRHFEFPFTVALLYVSVKWPLSRLVLWALRIPPLSLSQYQSESAPPTSGCSLRPVFFIPLTGMLTAVDVALGLAAFLSLSVTFIVIVKSLGWHFFFATVTT